jgi:signal transduction histidine kinase
MHERVRLLGGEFEIESKPGDGTTVRARLPLMTEDHEEAHG